jgi:hypothetical protein
VKNLPTVPLLTYSPLALRSVTLATALVVKMEIPNALERFPAQDMHPAIEEEQARQTDCDWLEAVRQKLKEAVRSGFLLCWAKAGTDVQTPQAFY